MAASRVPEEMMAAYPAIRPGALLASIPAAPKTTVTMPPKSSSSKPKPEAAPASAVKTSVHTRSTA